MRPKDFGKCLTRLEHEKKDKNVRSITVYHKTHAIICTNVSKAEVNGFSMPDIAALFFDDTLITMIKIEELTNISFIDYQNNQIYILDEGRTKWC